MSAKILLVDDETAITENLQPFLERTGFSVSVGHDGAAALQRIAEDLPDLVVLDVLMPKLDGREVLRRLRRDGCGVPVILLTRIGEAGERAMALEEGADDYLNKPFDPHELVARIRAVLRRATAGQRSLSSSHRLRSGALTLNRTAQRAHWDERQLSTRSKQLIDTIKMIAYRAETAMANCLHEHLKRPDEARRVLCALYNTEADLLPDPQAGTLTVRPHHSANAATDRAIEKLCEALNATETVFPRTNLRLVFKLGSMLIPRNQVL